MSLNISYIDFSCEKLGLRLLQTELETMIK